MKEILFNCITLSRFYLSFCAQKKVKFADKIIATMGDKIVLKSESENSISDMQHKREIRIMPNVFSWNRPAE